MSMIVQLIRSVIVLAILLGVLGCLVDFSKLVMSEAAFSHQRGGISFKSLNNLLEGH